MYLADEMKAPPSLRQSSVMWGSMTEYELTTLALLSTKLKIDANLRSSTRR